MLKLGVALPVCTVSRDSELGLLLCSFRENVTPPKAAVVGMEGSVH